MDVVPYDGDAHREMLRAWLTSYGLDPNDADAVPFIGFVAKDADGLIAQGFLRRIEGPYGLLEGLIANPKSFGKRRYRAIDAVVESLLRQASKLALKQVFATSKDKATLKRSIRHGFQVVPQTVIGVQLS